MGRKKIYLLPKSSGKGEHKKRIMKVDFVRFRATSGWDATTLYGPLQPAELKDERATAFGGALIRKRYADAATVLAQERL